MPESAFNLQPELKQGDGHGCPPGQSPQPSTRMGSNVTVYDPPQFKLPLRCLVLSSGAPRCSAKNPPHSADSHRHQHWRTKPNTAHPHSIAGPGNTKLTCSFPLVDLDAARESRSRKPLFCAALEFDVMQLLLSSCTDQRASSLPGFRPRQRFPARPHS
eukprot:3823712-Rhodomonas_salina.3